MLVLQAMPIVRNLPDPAGTAAVVTAPPAQDTGLEVGQGRGVTWIYLIISRLVGWWSAVDLVGGWTRRM